MYDVAVIGGGPAGAAAARRLAAGGLSTVLLEKGGPQREKVCSGFLMDAWPLVREEFGEVPPEVLCAEGRLLGISLMVPGEGAHVIDYPMPTAWRSTLDGWLVGRAEEAGAEVRRGSRLVGVAETEAGYSLRVRRREEEDAVHARHVVGADGTASVVRRWLHPELKVTYSQGIQEIYATSVDIAPDRWHVFLGREVAPFYFDVHRKDGLLVLECGCRPGGAEAVMGWGRRILAEGFGFDDAQQPLRRGACTEPGLYADLFSGRFQPARHNVLLVGDAAGLILPVTGEGIWGAVASARLAAEAILRSNATGVSAAERYLPALAGLTDVLKGAFDRARAAGRAFRAGGMALLPAVAPAWEGTLTRRK